MISITVRACSMTGEGLLASLLSQRKDQILLSPRLPRLPIQQNEGPGNSSCLSPKCQIDQRQWKKATTTRPQPCHYWLKLRRMQVPRLKYSLRRCHTGSLTNAHKKKKKKKLAQRLCGTSQGIAPRQEINQHRSKKQQTRSQETWAYGSILQASCFTNLDQLFSGPHFPISTAIKQNYSILKSFPALAFYPVLELDCLDGCLPSSK